MERDRSRPKNGPRERLRIFWRIGLRILGPGPHFNVSGFGAGRQIPVASTAFRCRVSLARAPQQIVAAAFASWSGTLVVTKSYDDTASVTGTRGTYERLDLSHRTNRRHHGNSVIPRIALGARDADFRDARKNRHARVGLELGASNCRRYCSNCAGFCS